MNESQDISPPTHNERGVIAEQYSQLQAVHVLEKARVMNPLPSASEESTSRAVLQAIEIALINLNDLTIRLTSDIQQHDFGSAVVKLSWIRGFHSVLVKLSTIMPKLGLVPLESQPPGKLCIHDSPAYQTYYASLLSLDKEIHLNMEQEQIDLRDLIHRKTLDDPQLRMFHLLRVSNHEATIWESNLQHIPLPYPVPSYAEFVVSTTMREAVYDTALKGDTYYTQFRGLHQIPEILVAEMNDHLEKAILLLRSHSFLQAYEHVMRVNVLSEPVISSVLPIAENLTTADYHNIRENLGLTSGSHSVNLHYYLFRDFYEQLWDAFCIHLLNLSEPLSQKQELQERLQCIDNNRLGEEAFLGYLFANELLRLRTFIFEWRNEHLHLPRTNIGGGTTRSLTGSPDAIQAVKRMRDAARLKDRARPLMEVRHLHASQENEAGMLMSYFESASSFDRTLLETTGSVTQERFKDVQERSGFFSQKSPFVPPERYIV